MNREELIAKAEAMRVEFHQRGDHDGQRIIEAALTALQSAEHLAPEDDAKAKRRCKCEFSSGGVWAKKCAFHAALQSREAVVRECVKKYLLDQVAHVEDNANKLATFAGEENEARCRKLAGSYLRELAQCVDLDAILKLLEKP